MSKYRLNVNVTGDDLNTIYAAKQRIVIAKHTAEQKSNVAWVSFKPFEHNTVDWETDFALYAATGEIQGGAKIAKLSDCSGQTQINATFANGYFSSSQPDNQIGPNSYEITNSDKDNALLTFGLAQSISVNGTAYDEHPINAILVPRGNSAVMTPIEKIDVFLESNIESSTVLSRIYTKCITLVYQGDTTELSLNYDPINGIFYPASK
ncbi:MAG: hypothetical protein LBN97_06715 [Oscillospiraceae bacterium]|jgi:hypothetical protein|nr:hypothetical protein [Oscillospiraceae bacterium]